MMSTKSAVEILGKPVRVHISGRAIKALEQREQVLVAEMELYFSCLIRKQVIFREAANSIYTAQFSNQLHVAFHPVMTQACGKHYQGDAPPLADFPIVNAKPYVPKWLKLDFKNQQWLGEFGYD